MHYREIPKTGDALSILGFGCMRLPLKEDRTIDVDRAVEQIRTSIDKGVNYFDTAWPYHSGESERILGKALKDGYRERVKVATKLPSWMITSREDMEYYLNTQLEKLGVKQIDYYLLHTLNGKNWDKLESFGVKDFLDSALEDGRIANAGFSFHGEIEDFKRIVDAYPWAMCQIQYNYLDQENQAGTEGLEYASARNLGVVVMEPLRGGNLGAEVQPEPIQEIWDRSTVKRAPVEWSLRWIWNRPEVTVILSGMNEENHIAQNIAIADEAYPDSLTAEECSLVDEVACKYKELMRVGCTGCGYCLPCPAGVQIPGAFEVYNKMHMFGNEVEGKLLYVIRLSGALSDQGAGYASQCVECGECLEKCPQNIDIPTVLADVADELEDDKMDERLGFAKEMLNIEK